MPDLLIIKTAKILLTKINYVSIIVKNKEYNNLNLNLNQIKAILHNKVLLKLTKQINNYDYVFVDQFINKKKYFIYIKDYPQVFKDITLLPKAETIHLSVACASIISRYFFIKEMELLSNKLKITLPYGSNQKVNQTALKIIKKYNLNKLKMCAKINFKNTKLIINNYYGCNHQ